MILTLASLQTLGSRLRLPRGALWALAASVAALVLFPTMRGQARTWREGVSYPGMARRLSPNVSGREPKIALLEQIIHAVPADASVSASHNLVPFLSHRSHIFMFPNPWKVMYWGIAGEKPANPESVDIILLDTGALDGELVQLAREVIAAGWDLLVDEQQLLFARRRQGPEG